MAKVIQRVWRSGPRKVRKAAWGFTLQVKGPDGKMRPERQYCKTWSKQEAQEALAARLLERDAPKPPAPAASKTLEAMFTDYLAHKRGEGKRSIQDDKERGRRLLDRFGAATPIAEITTKRVDEYRTVRSSQKSRLGRSLSQATVNREVALLRAVLRLAHEWELIDKLPKFKMAKEPKRLRFLSEDEIARLLPACAASHSRYLLPIVTVALHTGMRKSEVLGLTWERVDFSRNVLMLDKTKSGLERDLPINQAIYDVLAPLRAQALAALPAGGELTGPLWPKSGGAAWVSIRTAFERAMRAATIRNFTFHGLRHTFASWFVMRGGSLAKLQALLGHSTIGMTMRYAHLAPDHLQGATAILDGLGSPRPGAARNRTYVAHNGRDRFNSVATAS